MTLEEIAKKIVNMNFGEQEYFLLSIGRIQHIDFETGESTKLMQENPERFIRIGSKSVDRNKFSTLEEYNRVCMSNAAYLYERFPLIFEFYDELFNGIVQTVDLEELAKKIVNMNFGDQEKLLLSKGRKQHIDFETGESTKLMQENPERFIRIGSKSVDRNKFSTLEEYNKVCMSNAAYLYERFPLIFEFYDELMNGIVQTEELTPKGRK